jgi:hypothetical protein
MQQQIQKIMVKGAAVKVLVAEESYFFLPGNLFFVSRRALLCIFKQEISHSLSFKDNKLILQLYIKL